VKPTNCQALVARLHKVIVRKNTTWLRKLTARKSAKDAWTKVREITRGSGRNNRSLVEGLTAETFNAHHASIPTAIIVHRYPSTSLNYRTSTSRKWTSFRHWTLYDPLLLESTKFPHGPCDSEPLCLLHLLPSSLINRYRRLGPTPMENSSYYSQR